MKVATVIIALLLVDVVAAATSVPCLESRDCAAQTGGAQLLQRKSLVTAAPSRSAFAAFLAGLKKTSAKKRGEDSAGLNETNAAKLSEGSSGGPPRNNTDKVPAGQMADILETHNKYRCVHDADALVWDNKLAKLAKQWAKKAKGSMAHSPLDYRMNDHIKNDLKFAYVGENLAKGYGAGKDDEAVKLWYNEVNKVTSNKVTDYGPNGAYGHYTQVVWKATTSLGCALKGDLLVCHYGVGGNVNGQYEKNVKKSKRGAAAYKKAKEECGLS